MMKIHKPNTMRYSYIQFLLFSLVITLLQCNGNESPPDDATARSFAAAAASTQATKQIADLGDTDVDVDEPPAIASQMVNDSTWQQKLVDYDPRRTVSSTNNYTAEPATTRIPYENLQITAYLEDLISFNNYFKHKVYEKQKESSEDGLIRVFHQPDRQTEEELAYPLVRESYFTNYTNTYTNPGYLPMGPENTSPELYFEETTKYFHDLKELYGLMVTSSSKEQFFFDAPTDGNADARKRLKDYLIRYFKNVISEETNKIIAARVEAAGQLQTVQVFSYGPPSLREDEKPALIAAMKNRKTTAEFAERLQEDVVKLEASLVPLRNQLQAIETKYNALKTVLDSTQAAFVQQVYVATKTYIAQQEAQNQQLNDLATLPLDQTSVSMLIPTIETVGANIIIPKTEILESYKPIKNNFLQRVRALEAEFKRRQAEQ